MKEKRIGLFLRIFLCMVLVSGLTACGSEKADNTVNTQPDVKEAFQDDDKKETDLNTLESSKEDAGKQETGQGKDTLVVYFSATGTTKGVAEKIAAATDADMYEIVPAEPYSSAGLDWNDDNSRTTTEMNDKNARPEIGSGDVSHKCELKQAILVKLLYETHHSDFFGIVFFLTDNVNIFYLQN